MPCSCFLAPNPSLIMLPNKPKQCSTSAGSQALGHTLAMEAVRTGVAEMAKAAADGGR